MADNNKGRPVDWDEEISEEQVNEGRKQDDFVILPDGTYPFKVVKFERASYAGSKSLPACNQAKVGIIIDGGDKGRSYVTTNFFMVDKCLWTIYEFLTSIGLHKKGEGATVIPWRKVEQGISQLEGRCKISSRTFEGRDGEFTQNEVKKWLAPKIEQDY